MTAHELLNKVKDNFKERLQRKTGWGKNEVMTELDLAIVEEALRSLEKEEKHENR